jgi:hypothetical protein
MTLKHCGRWKEQGKVALLCEWALVQERREFIRLGGISIAIKEEDPDKNKPINAKLLIHITVTVLKRHFIVFVVFFHFYGSHQ